MVSLLLPFLYTLLFSRTGGVPPHLNSSTHRFPRCPLRNLRFLVMPAVSSLLQRTKHAAKLFYLPRIERIENLSCSTCSHVTRNASHLVLHCPATDSCAGCSLATLCLSTTSGQGPGELPGFWGSMVFCHASVLWKGSGNNNNYKNCR